MLVREEPGALGDEIGVVDEDAALQEARLHKLGPSTGPGHPPGDEDAVPLLRGARDQVAQHRGDEAVLVRPADSPLPGHCWYVVQNVPRLGPGLRLWQQTDWPDSEEMTDAEWSAFVSWWNTGVDGGWDTFSQLNATDDPPDLRPRFPHGAPIFAHPEIG